MAVVRVCSMELLLPLWKWLDHVEVFADGQSRMDSGNDGLSV